MFPTNLYCNNIKHSVWRSCVIVMMQKKVWKILKCIKSKAETCQQWMSPWFQKCWPLSHAEALGSDLCHRRRCSRSCLSVSSCVLCACETVPGFQVCSVGSHAHLLAHALPEKASCRTDHIPLHRSLCYLQKTGSWCTNDLQITNKLPTERLHVTFRVYARCRDLGYS